MLCPIAAVMEWEWTPANVRFLIKLNSWSFQKAGEVTYFIILPLHILPRQHLFVARLLLLHSRTIQLPFEMLVRYFFAAQTVKRTRTKLLCMQQWNSFPGKAKPQGFLFWQEMTLARQ